MLRVFICFCHVCFLSSNININSKKNSQKPKTKIKKKKKNSKSRLGSLSYALLALPSARDALPPEKFDAAAADERLAGALAIAPIDEGALDPVSGVLER